MRTNRSDCLIEALQGYFGSSPGELATQQSTPEGAVLGLVHEAAARVPAYTRFLDERGIDAASVETIDDFRLLPTTTKENYIQRNPLPDLCWDGELGDFI